VLIPVQPSPYDVCATAELVDLVRQRQEIAEGRPRAAFVVSRQIQGTRLATDVRDALEGYGLPVFSAGTVQRVIYANSAAGGATALDLEPQGPAAREIEAIKDELEAFA
jgi:chromosome partitioning protein